MYIRTREEDRTMTGCSPYLDWRNGGLEDGTLDSLEVDFPLVLFPYRSQVSE